MRRSGVRAAVLVLSLGATVVACNEILGLPDPTRDDSIGADAQPDRNALADAGADGSLDGGPDTGCGDIKTSKNNCGSCGYVCKFADCIGGFCSGTLITDAGAWDPLELRLGDAGALYFGNNPGTPGSPVQEIVRVDLTTLATQYVAPKQERIDQFSVAEPNLYFANYNDAGKGTVSRCATGGCAGTRIDFVKQAGVRPDGVWTDGPSVYFTYYDHTDAGGSINRCPTPDCDAGMQTVLGFDQPDVILGDGADLFWTDSSPVLWTCPRASCTTPLALATAPIFTDFTIDATHVYWADDVTGKVIRTLRDGSGPLEYWADNRPAPDAIAVDDTYVYWLEAGLATGNGSLHRCAKAKPCTPDATLIDDLANGINNPNDIALDATSIYWASDDGVFRLPKPP